MTITDEELGRAKVFKGRLMGRLAEEVGALRRRLQENLNKRSESIDKCETMWARAVKAEKELTKHINVESSTYGNLPWGVRNLIEPHVWDNKNYGEQRDWAVQAIDAALVRIGKMRGTILSNGEVEYQLGILLSKAEAKIKELEGRWNRYRDADNRAKIIQRSGEVEEAYRIQCEALDSSRKEAAMLREAVMIALAELYEKHQSPNFCHRIYVEVLSQSSSDWDKKRLAEARAAGIEWALENSVLNPDNLVRLQAEAKRIREGR